MSRCHFPKGLFKYQKPLSKLHQPPMWQPMIQSYCLTFKPNIHPSPSPVQSTRSITHKIPHNKIHPRGLKNSTANIVKDLPHIGTTCPKETHNAESSMHICNQSLIKKSSTAAWMQAPLSFLTSLITPRSWDCWWRCFLNQLKSNRIQGQLHTLMHCWLHKHCIEYCWLQQLVHDSRRIAWEIRSLSYTPKLRIDFLTPSCSPPVSQNNTVWPTVFSAEGLSHQ